MPRQFEPKALYTVEYCTDTFVDACLRDEGGRLLLLSVFGRDTAIKELQARIQLGSQHHDGLTELILKPVDDVSTLSTQRAVVGDPKALQKATGRLPQCVYGNLTHMWLYNPTLKTPQPGADVAWVVVRTDGVHADQSACMREMHQRIWAAVTELASIPLLPHWDKAVIEAITQAGMVLRMGMSGNDLVHPLLSAPLGPFIVCKVQMDQSKLNQLVTSMVKSGRLTLEPESEQQQSRLQAA